ncbi:MAG: M1 family metallopeptidase [Pyrinomonadaceae bacterium]
MDDWRPINYDVSLSFDDKLSEITKARTIISVLILKDAVTRLDFDFGEMNVDSVTVGDAPARYERSAGTLSVTLPQAAKDGERLSVSISYHGKPKDGLALTADKDGKPSATGDNWPNRAHHWIPCLDHPSAKATVNFTVTAPARDVVIANGKREATRDNADATRTWSYTESVPIPPYCMIVSIGEGALFEPKTNAPTPLIYYVPQRDRDYAVQGFASSSDTLNFFTQMVAPYPYEKLALIVGATRFGGMENSSAIVFASTLFDKRDASPKMSARYHIPGGVENVVAHEIAHQWFGDAVTEKTWADLWLSEGFATYFAGLFVEHFEGEQVFRDYMKGEADGYFKYEQTRRAPIHDTETEDLFKLLNANNYNKGAWVLHMLHSMLGDKDFFQGIRAYYAAHRNSTATTEDLRAALEKSSDTNLREFFARWVYGSGHPRYDVAWNWKEAKKKKGVLTITVRQTQDGELFPNPMPIEIVSADGTQRVLMKAKKKETILRVPLQHKPTEVRFDPDGTILKEVNLRPA